MLFKIISIKSIFAILVLLQVRADDDSSPVLVDEMEFDDGSIYRAAESTNGVNKEPQGLELRVSRKMVKMEKAPSNQNHFYKNFPNEPKCLEGIQCDKPLAGCFEGRCFPEVNAATQRPYVVYLTRKECSPGAGNVLPNLSWTFCDPTTKMYALAGDVTAMNENYTAIEETFLPGKIGCTFNGDCEENYVCMRGQNYTTICRFNPMKSSTSIYNVMPIFYAWSAFLVSFSIAILSLAAHWVFLREEDLSEESEDTMEEE